MAWGKCGHWCAVPSSVTRGRGPQLLSPVFTSLVRWSRKSYLPRRSTKKRTFVCYTLFHSLLTNLSDHCFNDFLCSVNRWQRLETFCMLSVVLTSARASFVTSALLLYQKNERKRREARGEHCPVSLQRRTFFSWKIKEIESSIWSNRRKQSCEEKVGL